jgi:hypothetical protein
MQITNLHPVDRWPMMCQLAVAADKDQNVVVAAASTIMMCSADHKPFVVVATQLLADYEPMDWADAPEHGAAQQLIVDNLLKSI